MDTGDSNLNNSSAGFNTYKMDPDQITPSPIAKELVKQLGIVTIKNIVRQSPEKAIPLQDLCNQFLSQAGEKEREAVGQEVSDVMDTLKLYPQLFNMYQIEEGVVSINLVKDARIPALLSAVVKVKGILKDAGSLSVEELFSQFQESCTSEEIEAIKSGDVKVFEDTLKSLPDIFNLSGSQVNLVVSEEIGMENGVKDDNEDDETHSDENDEKGMDMKMHGDGEEMSEVNDEQNSISVTKETETSDQADEMLDENEDKKDVDGSIDVSSEQEQDVGNEGETQSEDGISGNPGSVDQVDELDVEYVSEKEDSELEGDDQLDQNQEEQGDESLPCPASTSLSSSSNNNDGTQDSSVETNETAVDNDDQDVATKLAKQLGIVKIINILKERGSVSLQILNSVFGGRGTKEERDAVGRKADKVLETMTEFKDIFVFESHPERGNSLLEQQFAGLKDSGENETSLALARAVMKIPAILQERGNLNANQLSTVLNQRSSVAEKNAIGKNHTLLKETLSALPTLFKFSGETIVLITDSLPIEQPQAKQQASNEESPPSSAASAPVLFDETFVYKHLGILRIKDFLPKNGSFSLQKISSNFGSQAVDEERGAVGWRALEVLETLKAYPNIFNIKLPKQEDTQHFSERTKVCLKPSSEKEVSVPYARAMLRLILCLKQKGTLLITQLCSMFGQNSSAEERESVGKSPGLLKTTLKTLPKMFSISGDKISLVDNAHMYALNQFVFCVKTQPIAKAAQKPVQDLTSTVPDDLKRSVVATVTECLYSTGGSCDLTVITAWIKRCGSAQEKQMFGDNGSFLLKVLKTMPQRFGFKGSKVGFASSGNSSISKNFAGSNGGNIPSLLSLPHSANRMPPVNPVPLLGMFPMSQAKVIPSIEIVVDTKNARGNSFGASSMGVKSQSYAQAISQIPPLSSANIQGINVTSNNQTTSKPSKAKLSALQKLSAHLMKVKIATILQLGGRLSQLSAEERKAVGKNPGLLYDTLISLPDQFIIVGPFVGVKSHAAFITAIAKLVTYVESKGRCEITSLTGKICQAGTISEREALGKDKETFTTTISALNGIFNIEGTLVYLNNGWNGRPVNIPTPMNKTTAVSENIGWVKSAGTSAIRTTIHVPLPNQTKDSNPAQASVNPQIPIAPVRQEDANSPSYKLHFLAVTDEAGCQQFVDECLSKYEYPIISLSVRKGQRLIAIAGWEGNVYMFDMSRAEGETASPAGFRILADVISSEKILKVVQDCQYLSAALSECFGMKLANVFDTRVAYQLLTGKSNVTIDKLCTEYGIAAPRHWIAVVISKSATVSKQADIPLGAWVRVLIPQIYQHMVMKFNSDSLQEVGKQCEGFLQHNDSRPPSSTNLPFHQDDYRPTSPTLPVSSSAVLSRHHHSTKLDVEDAFPKQVNQCNVQEDLTPMNNQMHQSLPQVDDTSSAASSYLPGGSDTASKECLSASPDAFTKAASTSQLNSINTQTHTILPSAASSNLPMGLETASNEHQSASHDAFTTAASASQHDGIPLHNQTHAVLPSAVSKESSHSAPPSSTILSAEVSLFLLSEDLPQSASQIEKVETVSQVGRTSEADLPAVSEVEYSTKPHMSSSEFTQVCASDHTSEMEKEVDRSLQLGDVAQLDATFSPSSSQHNGPVSAVSSILSQSSKTISADIAHAADGTTQTSAQDTFVTTTQPNNLQEITPPLTTQADQLQVGATSSEDMHSKIHQYLCANGASSVVDVYGTIYGTDNTMNRDCLSSFEADLRKNPSRYIVLASGLIDLVEHVHSNSVARILSILKDESVLESSQLLKIFKMSATVDEIKVVAGTKKAFLKVLTSLSEVYVRKDKKVCLLADVRKQVVKVMDEDTKGQILHMQPRGVSLPKQNVENREPKKDPMLSKESTTSLASVDVGDISPKQIHLPIVQEDLTLTLLNTQMHQCLSSSNTVSADMSTTSDGTTQTSAQDTLVTTAQSNGLQEIMPPADQSQIGATSSEDVHSRIHRYLCKNGASSIMDLYGIIYGADHIMNRDDDCLRSLEADLRMNPSRNIVLESGLIDLVEHVVEHAVSRIVYILKEEGVLDSSQLLKLFKERASIDEIKVVAGTKKLFLKILTSRNEVCVFKDKKVCLLADVRTQVGRKVAEYVRQLDGIHVDRLSRWFLKNATAEELQACEGEHGLYDILTDASDVFNVTDSFVTVMDSDRKEQILQLQPRGVSLPKQNQGMENYDSKRISVFSTDIQERATSLDDRKQTTCDKRLLGGFIPEPYQTHNTNVSLGSLTDTQVKNSKIMKKEKVSKDQKALLQVYVDTNGPKSLEELHHHLQTTARVNVKLEHIHDLLSYEGKITSFIKMPSGHVSSPVCMIVQFLESERTSSITRIYKWLVESYGEGEFSSTEKAVLGRLKELSHIFDVDWIGKRISLRLRPLYRSNRNKKNEDGSRADFGLSKVIYFKMGFLKEQYIKPLWIYVEQNGPTDISELLELVHERIGSENIISKEELLRNLKSFMYSMNFTIKQRSDLIEPNRAKQQAAIKVAKFLQTSGENTISSVWKWFDHYGNDSEKKSFGETERAFTKTLKSMPNMFHVSGSNVTVSSEYQSEHIDEAATVAEVANSSSRLPTLLSANDERGIASLKEDVPRILEMPPVLVPVTEPSSNMAVSIVKKNGTLRNKDFLQIFVEQHGPVQLSELHEKLHEKLGVNDVISEDNLKKALKISVDAFKILPNGLVEPKSDRLNAANKVVQFLEVNASSNILDVWKWFRQHADQSEAGALNAARKVTRFKNALRMFPYLFVVKNDIVSLHSDYLHWRSISSLINDNETVLDGLSAPSEDDKEREVSMSEPSASAPLTESSSKAYTLVLKKGGKLRKNIKVFVQTFVEQHGPVGISELNEKLHEKLGVDNVISKNDLTDALQKSGNFIKFHSSNTIGPNINRVTAANRIVQFLEMHGPTSLHDVQSWFCQNANQQEIGALKATRTVARFKNGLKLFPYLFVLVDGIVSLHQGYFHWRSNSSLAIDDQIGVDDESLTTSSMNDTGRIESVQQVPQKSSVSASMAEPFEKVTTLVLRKNGGLRSDSKKFVQALLEQNGPVQLSELNGKLHEKLGIDNILSESDLAKALQKNSALFKFHSSNIVGPDPKRVAASKKLVQFFEKHGPSSICDVQNWFCQNANQNQINVMKANLSIRKFTNCLKKFPYLFVIKDGIVSLHLNHPQRSMSSVPRDVVHSTIDDVDQTNTPDLSMASDEDHGINGQNMLQDMTELHVNPAVKESSNDQTSDATCSTNNGESELDLKQTKYQLEDMSDAEAELGACGGATRVTWSTDINSISDCNDVVEIEFVADSTEITKLADGSASCQQPVNEAHVSSAYIKNGYLTRKVKNVLQVFLEQNGPATLIQVHSMLCAHFDIKGMISVDELEAGLKKSSGTFRLLPSGLVQIETAVIPHVFTKAGHLKDKFKKCLQIYLEQNGPTSLLQLHKVLHNYLCAENIISVNELEMTLREMSGSFKFLPFGLVGGIPDAIRIQAINKVLHFLEMNGPSGIFDVRSWFCLHASLDEMDVLRIKWEDEFKNQLRKCHRVLIENDIAQLHPDFIEGMTSGLSDGQDSNQAHSIAEDFTQKDTEVNVSKISDEDQVTSALREIQASTQECTTKTENAVRFEDNSAVQMPSDPSYNDIILLDEYNDNDKMESHLCTLEEEPIAFYQTVNDAHESSYIKNGFLNRKVKNVLQLFLEQNGPATLEQLHNVLCGHFGVKGMITIDELETGLKTSPKTFRLLSSGLVQLDPNGSLLSAVKKLKQFLEINGRTDIQDLHKWFCQNASEEEQVALRATRTTDCFKNGLKMFHNDFLVMTHSVILHIDFRDNKRSTSSVTETNQTMFTYDFMQTDAPDVLGSESPDERLDIVPSSISHDANETDALQDKMEPHGNIEMDPSTSFNTTIGEMCPANHNIPEYKMNIDLPRYQADDFSSKDGDELGLCDVAAVKETESDSFLKSSSKDSEMASASNNAVEPENYKAAVFTKKGRLRKYLKEYLQKYLEREGPASLLELHGLLHKRIFAENIVISMSTLKKTLRGMKESFKFLPTGLIEDVPNEIRIQAISKVLQYLEMNGPSGIFDIQTWFCQHANTAEIAILRATRIKAFKLQLGKCDCILVDIDTGIVQLYPDFLEEMTSGSSDDQDSNQAEDFTQRDTEENMSEISHNDEVTSALHEIHASTHENTTKTENAVRFEDNSAVHMPSDPSYNDIIIPEEYNGNDNMESHLCTLEEEPIGTNSEGYNSFDVEDSFALKLDDTHGGVFVHNDIEVLNPWGITQQLRNEFSQRNKQDMDKLMTVFGEDISCHLTQLYQRFNKLTEIILDCGRFAQARYYQKEAHNGCVDIQASTNTVTKQFIQSVLGKDGVTSPSTDNRAGIEGTLHRLGIIPNRNGEAIGVTASISRTVLGCVDHIHDLLQGGQSIVLLGSPGVGMTTVLREISRVLSDVKKRRVVVIDTYNQIGGDSDVAHPAIGSARRLQLASSADQSKIMVEALKHHNPQTVIIDEIVTSKDAQGVRSLVQRGVQVIATAHSCNFVDFFLNPEFKGVSGMTEGAGARGKASPQRVQDPAFQILIEMKDRDTWIVHKDLVSSIDLYLEGMRPIVQERQQTWTYDAQGEPIGQKCIVKLIEAPVSSMLEM